MILRTEGHHPRGRQHQTVAGGGIRIHRNAIKRLIRGPCQHGLQNVRINGRIGDNVTQHRGHVGFDHARSLGDPIQGDGGPAGQTHLMRGAFGIGVRGGDGIAGGVPAFGRGMGNQGGMVGQDAVGGKGLPNDPRGAVGNLIRGTVQVMGQIRRDGIHRVIARFSRKHVGIPRHNGYGADGASGGHAAAVFHRRRGGARQGKHTSKAGRTVKHKQGDIIPPLIPHTGGGGGHTHPRHGGQSDDALGGKGGTC